MLTLSIAIVAFVALAGPNPSLVAGADAPTETEIERAIRQRDRFGMRADAPYVISVAQDPLANLQFGIPLLPAEVESMNYRGKVRDLIEPVRRYVTDRPEIFGGVFIDQKDQASVHLLVTPGHDKEAASARSLVPEEVRLSQHSVEHSLQYLRDLHGRLTRTWRDGGESMAGVVSIATNVAANAVAVGTVLDRDSAVSERIAQAFPFEPVLVEEEGKGTPTCTRTACFQDPWRGGLRINDCTSGFVVFDGDLTSRTRMLTAGHCSDPYNANYYHNGQYMGEGKLKTYRNGSNADFAIVGINQAWASHIVFVSSTDQSRSMSWRISAGQDVFGDAVCMSGRVSGKTCGNITGVDVTWEIRPGITLTDQIRADYDIDYGDSGAPVFYLDRAYGIQSGAGQHPTEPGELWRPKFSNIGLLYSATDNRTGDPLHYGLCNDQDLVTSC